MFSPASFSTLLVALSLLRASAGDEVIYDNTQFFLSGYASETREYGDQLDLEGTARTLTEITFYYFGDFVSDGDEAMKVRLYSNETPYDMYRNAPTRLLYESGNMPLKQGYNLRSIDNLNIKLPGNSVTVTIEFKGLASDEIAGLLLYSPPTVGSSFNEFWGKGPSGGWAPFIYSTTDPARKANAGIKLVARPEPVVSDAQTNAAAAVALRGFTTDYRVAQTFKPDSGGKLDRVSLSLESMGSPIRLSLLDTDGGKPGTNVLATQLVQPTPEGKVDASFYEQAIYLKTGTSYAWEIIATTAPPENSEERVLCSLDNVYKQGRLWVRTNSPGSAWEEASITAANQDIDAVFAVSMVPADPPVRIISPSVGQVIPYGETVLITVETNLPSISQIYRVRFYDGNNELEFVQRPPYQVAWHATNSGPHNIRVVVEDTFGRPFRAEPHSVTVLEAPPEPDERRASINQGPEGKISLRFKSKSSETIRVEYSDDLEKWKTADGDLLGNGEELDYDDDGPPKTDQHPKDTLRRYYRVVFGP